MTYYVCFLFVSSQLECECHQSWSSCVWFNAVTILPTPFLKQLLQGSVAGGRGSVKPKPFSENTKMLCAFPTLILSAVYSAVF